ncbi:hypothetical protein N0V90_012063 [Kalmusia sp. IMI 367209]|nr:hypothetical protein N0V90_012063 [Kalmusia sp. IMI 367209]
MCNLSQEIIDCISSHLDRYDLCSTLTVNSKFQASAERYSGAYKQFYLDKSTADRFLRTFSGRHFRHLRRVHFATTLIPNDIPPNHRQLDPSDVDEDDIPQCRESEDTLQEYNESFTAQVGFLFDMLNTVERRVGDTYGPGKISLTILTPTMELDPSIYCRHRAYVSLRVHLLNPGSLPALKSIRRLRFQNGAKFSPFEEPQITLRKLDLRILLDMAYKLPNLENLACEIGGDEWPTPLSHEVGSHLWHMYQGPRRDSRHDFAQNLDSTSLPTRLRELELNFIHPLSHIDAIDQRIAMPDLTAPFLYDPFSTSLRISSYQLRRMYLFAVVDGTLFWPADGSEPPTWPSLEVLDVCFHMVSPSGKWYFKGLRESERGQLKGYELDESAYPPVETTTDDEYWCDRVDEVDWDETSDAQFRVVPDDEAILPFLEAFAKAAARMPKLKDAVLWCPLTFATQLNDSGDDVDYLECAIPDLFKFGPENLAWGIAYTKPNQKAFSGRADEDHTPERQLWWLVGNQWRPSSHLHERFRQIGREKYGHGLVEHWNDEHFGDGLVERYVFERHQRTIWSSTT